MCACASRVESSVCVLAFLFVCVGAFMRLCIHEVVHGCMCVCACRLRGLACARRLCVVVSRGVFCCLSVSLVVCLFFIVRYVLACMCLFAVFASARKICIWLGRKIYHVVCQKHGMFGFGRSLLLKSGGTGHFQGQLAEGHEVLVGDLVGVTTLACSSVLV